jgi:hypothetical protein
MFDRLFGRKGKGNGEKKAGPLEWIAAQDTRNPYQMRVLDCRPIVSSYTSTTQDPAVAQHFAQRDRSGVAYRGQSTERSLLIDSDLTYPLPDAGLPEGPLFVATEMEDKWDIFHFGQQLYFVRSWTGHLTALGWIRPGADIFTLEQIEVNSQGVQGDRNFAIRQVDFLIKSHILNLSVPHPIMPTMGDDPQQIALSAFSLYGRRGEFASFEDTLRVRPPE